MSLLDRAARRAAGATRRGPTVRAEQSERSELLSRRETLRRGAGAAGVLAIGGTMLTAAPARAGGQTRLQCDAACVTSHPGSIDRALARCGPATKNFLDNFPGFFREISGGAVYDACVAGVLAEDAYQRAQCIADCDDHCSTFGTRDTCEAHVEPVSAAGVAPPPQVWNPSGCGCVDGDTCCVCPSCDNGVGLCCIYGDCRCVA